MAAAVKDHGYSNNPDVVSKVAVLETAIKQHEQMLAKIDTTLERLSNISQDIGKILAVSENKIDNHQSTIQDILTRFEQHRTDDLEEHSNFIKAINSNTDTFSVKLEEISDKFTNSITQHEENINVKFCEIGTKIDTSGKRITDLENLKWIGFGIIIVIFWISKQDVSSLLSGFFHF